MTKNKVLLLAGPTASGKSNFALQWARANNGVIINTDSMQVYSVLHVLTARPNKDEMDLVPHHLYGTINPDIHFSTGLWLREVETLLNELGQVPIVFVGGTGLYFKALLGGLSQIPNVPDDMRLKWQEILENTNIIEIYKKLQTIDPILSGRIKPQDTQRILRAMEVYEATGKSLSWWQEQKSKPLIQNADKLILLPERDILYQRINDRFDHMIEKGALDEVRQLKALNLNSMLPALKAIGVPELSQALDGNLDIDQAIEAAKMQTRRYAKRQTTWFKHQMDETWQRKIAF